MVVSFVSMTSPKKQEKRLGSHSPLTKLFLTRSPGNLRSRKTSASSISRMAFRRLINLKIP